MSERTKLKSWVSLTLTGARQLVIVFFYHVGVWKLGPDYTLVVVFSFQIVQLFEIVLCALSSAHASVLSTLS